MQQKAESLFHRIPARHFILGAALIAALVIALTGETNAAAAAPETVEGGGISVDGVVVAGGDSEDTLTQLYEAVLDSYCTEDTDSVQALNEVEIAAGEYSVSLPQGEQAQDALTEALTVQTITCVTVTETLDYGTVTVEDDSMYEDESTTVEGHAGEKVTTSYEICVNGEVLLVKPGGSEVTVEPVDTVVTVGTKEYSMGSQIVAYAMQFLGNPYSWGGTSLTNGCDCSGFVLKVYQHFGVTLSHSSWAQSRAGTSVSYSEAQPGDIVFYTTSGSSSGGHVGIYLGNGRMISALNASRGICITDVKTSGLRICRIFN